MLECSSRAGSRKLQMRTNRRTPTPRLPSRGHGCSHVQLARPKLPVGNSLNTTEPQTLGGERARQQGREPGPRTSSPRAGPSPGCHGARTTQAAAPGPQPSTGGGRENEEASRPGGWSRAAWAPLAQTAAPRLRRGPPAHLRSHAVGNPSALNDCILSRLNIL